ARAAPTDQLAALSRRLGPERAFAPRGGRARRTRSERGRAVSLRAGCGRTARGAHGSPDAPQVSRMGRSHAASVRGRCAGLSTVRRTEDGPGDDRWPGGDPPDPDPPWPLGGWGGGVARGAWVPVGRGRP